MTTIMLSVKLIEVSQSVSRSLLEKMLKYKHLPYFPSPENAHAELYTCVHTCKCGLSFDVRVFAKNVIVVVKESYKAVVFMILATIYYYLHKYF